jgi:hypothetical protein
VLDVYGLAFAPGISDQAFPFKDDCHKRDPVFPDSDSVVVVPEQIPVLEAEAVPPTERSSTVTRKALVMAEGQLALVTLAL